jgi:hypothetical protein
MRVASSGHQIVDALDFSVNKVDAVMYQYLRIQVGLRATVFGRGEGCLGELRRRSRAKLINLSGERFVIRQS